MSRGSDRARMRVARVERAMAAAFMLVAAPAIAQTASDAEIVVTGSGLQQPLGSAAYDVVTIDRAQLTGAASGRLEDALRAAGVDRFRRSDARSAHPTSQGATLRGLGGNAASRALVLLDGVPLADPFNGNIAYSALDPTRIGLARVTRGGGTGSFGPGALAGTIELESAGPDDLVPAWGGAFYGSRDSVDLDAGVAARLAGGFASFGGSFARGDGFVPIVRSQRGPADVRAPYRQWSIAGRAVIPVTPEVEAQAALSTFGDKRTRGSAFTDNHSKGTDASLRLVGRGRWGWEVAGWYKRRRFASEFASINAPRTLAIESLDQYSVPATGVGSRLELRPPVGHGIELRVGGDYRRDQGRTRENFQFVAGTATRNRVAGGNSTTFGVFAEASVKPIDGLTLTAGGRVDRWHIEDGSIRQTVLAGGAVLPGTVDFVDRSGTRPTGRAGFAWKPAGAVTLRSAAYLGWRLPTLNELYRPFRVGNDSTVANATLKPERLRGIDLGVDYRPLRALKLSATVFTNRLDDAIANVTVVGPTRAALCPGLAAAGACRQRQNVEAIRSRGLELNAALALGDWAVDLDYELTDARVRASGAAALLGGLRPAQTPRQQGTATLAWHPASGPAAAVTLHYVSSQFDDDQNANRLRSAVTVDATASMPIFGRLRAEVRVENIGDKTVDAGYSNGTVLERATPRTVWVGLRYGG